VICLKQRQLIIQILALTLRKKMRPLFIILLSVFVLSQGRSQSHLTLIYTGSNNNVAGAVQKANEILNSTSFYEQIRKIAKFDHSSLTGQQVADRMQSASQQIRVVRKIKPIANASTKTSDKIKISRSLFGLDSTGKFVLSIAVNTLIHETVHAVDFLNTGSEFTHDGNRSDGQENTAPWMIGDIAERMVLENR